MMSKMMGVTDPRAHRHAIDTGLAMQMTNIARDIREDLERGRVYLPTTWLTPEAKTAITNFPALNMNVNVPMHLPMNVKPSPAPAIPHGPAFAPLAKRLVDRAECLYASGEQGLRYLPFRAALAVACAQAIYREIGRKVVARGTNAWDTRTVVSLPRKIALAIGAIAKAVASRPFFNSGARDPA